MVRSNKGLTLIELILVMAIIGIVIQIAYSMLNFGGASADVSTNISFTQQDVRILGDLIKNELMYATSMTTDHELVEQHYTRDYYSLEVEKNGGSSAIVRKYYKYIETDSEIIPDYYDISEKRVTGNWLSISIQNISNGTISVDIRHSLKKGRSISNYVLPFEINFINNPELVSGIDIDLMSEGTVLYYTKPHDYLVGKTIDIPANPCNNPLPDTTPEPTITPDPTEEPELPEETPVPKPSIVAIMKGDIEIDGNINPKTNKDGRYLVKKANQGGSSVKLWLLGFTNNHVGRVEVTVGSIKQEVKIDQENNRYIEFKALAGNNGSGEVFDVNVFIKTEVWENSYVTNSYTLKFITD